MGTTIENSILCRILWDVAMNSYGKKTTTQNELSEENLKPWIFFSPPKEEKGPLAEITVY